ncbi:MAG: sigma-70 family RNA polymerase sigma factor [Planctomycetota bacterium]|nr:sigma-70 family RNA polymerase sigma factor [Planctomycetota bacterium]
MKNIGKFRGDSSLSTWLTRIAVNECRSHHRKLRVRLKLLSGAAERVRRTHQVKTDMALNDCEWFSRVRRAVQKLPARYREVVVLRYLEETPTAEIAEVLSVSRAVVDIRLHRAREKLKNMLADLIEE